MALGGTAMPLRRSLLIGSIVAIATLGTAVRAGAACDVAGADATALAGAYAAIETSCPCDVAGRALYLDCARAAVRNQINGALNPECRRDAFNFARLSRCGGPGAVVCCRLTRLGNERHRIFGDASRCTAPPSGSACVSEKNSIVTGCDASGCVAPAVCGNGVVEDGEECDPPDLVTCDFSCQHIGCDEPPPGLCGNGVLDAGEACEPPGTATCGRTCQPAPCGSPPAGETTVACVDGLVPIAAASNGQGYLAAWSTPFLQPESDILARRLDGDGEPLDAGPTVLSAGVLCQ